MLVKANKDGLEIDHNRFISDTSTALLLYLILLIFNFDIVEELIPETELTKELTQISVNTTLIAALLFSLLQLSE